MSGATVLSHLRPYQRPDHFADWSGIDRSAYHVAYAQHRDSDTVTRSNFRVMLRALGGESDTVFILRSSHFLVGWCEDIYVDPADVRACETADGILRKLEEYPVASDDDLSDLEWTEAAQYWARMSVRERAEYCARFDVSIFAARRAEIPEDASGGLLEALNGC